MSRFTLVLSALLILSGCTGPDDATTPPKAEPTNITVADVARDYIHLISMTKKPVYVDPGLAMQCKGVSQADVEKAQKVSGPHAHTLVSIYMNPPAAKAFRAGADTYPVGSVIVKEKQALGYFKEYSRREEVKPNDGVGGMIKRPPGYDPEHGDWEYFYFEDASNIESGKIASCVQCHSGAAGKDHVFGGWAAPQ